MCIRDRSVVEDTYTHTTETEKYDPVKVKDDSSSGSSTDSDLPVVQTLSLIHI